jgi:hypothetical protein
VPGKQEEEEEEEEEEVVEAEEEEEEEEERLGWDRKRIKCVEPPAAAPLFAPSQALHRELCARSTCCRGPCPAPFAHE